MSNADKFDELAILELMGHRRLAGKVFEAVIAGGSFRIDVPKSDTETITQFYGPPAIYAISPVSEEIAREIARNSEPEPVHRYEISGLITARAIEGDPPDDEEGPW